jgi:hypothetical protein
MQTFSDCLNVFGFSNAEFFATRLFHESFRTAFPVPRDDCGLSIATPPEKWRQYVAFYRWPDGKFETVGFCNWIRYGNVYLEGGLCVQRTFYRRLSKEHWKECQIAGGVAQIVIETAARDLSDCAAWFGYCGDKKSFAVNARVGYISTRHKYLIVKWFANLDCEKQRLLEDRIAEMGPF